MVVGLLGAVNSVLIIALARPLDLPQDDLTCGRSLAASKALGFEPQSTLHSQEDILPFARIDLVQGKTSEYRAAVADIVYQGIVGVLKAPEGDRFIVIGEHPPDNLIYDPHFLGWNRSPDFILIQVTSTVGNNKDSKLAFFRFIADELKSKLSVRPDDVMINLVFVDRSDWSFGNGEPW